MLEAIRKNVTWAVIPLAAFAGGSAFLAVQLILMERLMDVGAGLSLRFIASLVTGIDSLTSPDPNIAISGVVLHYAPYAPS